MNFDPSHRTVKRLFWAALYRGEAKRCPTCDQHAQVYHRTITNAMGYAMVDMYEAAEKDYVHLASVITGQRADEAKLVHWGLIEEEKILRPDGGRAGWWRLTDKGVDFLRGRIKVPSHIWLYNSRCLGVDDDMKITIKDVMGNTFNLHELLNDRKKMR